MKSEGIVKWYDFEKGYGFATAEINNQKTDVLIHFSELKEGPFVQMEEGDLLEFDLIYKNSKPFASQITRGGFIKQ